MIGFKRVPDLLRGQRLLEEIAFVVCGQHLKDVIVFFYPKDLEPKMAV